MKNETRSRFMKSTFGSPRFAAFTLIELLVVIAVMAILASLVIPVGGAIRKRMTISKAQGELQQISGAIESYKAKQGIYPPDNPNNINTNQLYYELIGTTLNPANNVYTSKDGSSTIAASAVPTVFGPGVGGFVNCTKGAGGDEGTIAQNFLKANLRANQMALLANGAKVLVCSVGWPANLTPPPLPIPAGAPTGPNPWRYISSNPTNNPRSFDLWVDVVIGGKTNRVCNWSDRPIIP